MKMTTQIRLDEMLAAKLKIIAEKEIRSMNAQLEYFILKGVEAYESANGEIILPKS